MCEIDGVDDGLRAALRRLGFEASGWAVAEPLHNRYLTAGIWSLERDDQQMIVKRLTRRRDMRSSAYDRPWTAGLHLPARWNYWAREPLAYRHSLTDSFAAAGLRGPRCLGVDIGADDAVLALELVDGVPGSAWDVGSYAQAARALGRGQARYLEGEPLPAHAWLSRRFLREYSSEKGVRWQLLDDNEAWDQPLVAEHFPQELREAAKELHEHRDRLYEIVESLPQTLSHLDFWTNNLIDAGSGDLVLIDWAFAGVGAAGEDIGNLVPDAVFDHYVEPEMLSTLRRSVLDAYLDGLEQGGWTGDPVSIELAMAASAVKYDWLTVLMLERAAQLEHRRYGGDDSIDAAELYEKRGIALLANANEGLRALELRL